MQPLVRMMFFIDFWNYELTMKEFEPEFLTDWFSLPKAIKAACASLIDDPVEYERCFIFGSYDPKSSSDIKLRSWANTVLAKIPGVSVSFVPRQQKTQGPHCNSEEHHEIKECPICGASLLGTQEKGVDTQIVTEMLDMGFSRRCDAVVLVSADKDFVPAVEKLANNSIKVIHAYFPNHGSDPMLQLSIELSWQKLILTVTGYEFRLFYVILMSEKDIPLPPPD